MPQHGFCNIDLFESDLHRFRQGDRIVKRAVGRPETRHRHADDIAHGAAGSLRRARRNEQRERGIQPPGQADHQCLRTGVRQPPFQPFRLHGQDKLRAFSQFAFPLGHERKARISARQLRLFRFRAVGNDQISPVFFVAEVRGFAALVQQERHVYLAHGGFF